MKLVPIIEGCGRGHTLWLLEGGERIFLVPTLNGRLYHSNTRWDWEQTESDKQKIDEAIKACNTDKETVFYGEEEDSETKEEITGFFHAMFVDHLNSLYRFSDAKVYAEMNGVSFSLHPFD